MRHAAIHAVTIDLWGTLFIDSPAADERYQRERVLRVAEALLERGIEVPVASLAKAYVESRRHLLRAWRDLRDVPVERHVTLLLQGVDPALPGRLDQAGLAAAAWAYASPALDAPPSLDPGAAAAFDALAERGIAVCLVSNTLRTPGSVLRRILYNAGLRGAFAGMVFSDECGFRKPNPAIFQCALERLDVPARHAVHVGDDAWLDVEGPHLVKMRAIRLGDAGPGVGEGAQRVPDAVIQSLSELPAAVDRLRTEPSPAPADAFPLTQIAGHR